MNAQPTNDLNKTAEQLVTEMQQLIGGSPTNPAFNTRIAMEALHKFACVLTVVSAAADKQSRRIVRLTWALLVFTAMLFAFTVFLYKDTHALVNHEEFTQHHQLQPSQSPEAKP